MAEKEQVIKEKVENSGLFDFIGLYSFAHSWLKSRGYGVNEDEYKEKVNNNKRDISVKWTATKNMSDYFKFENKIKVEVKGMTDVEAEIDGNKKKMNQGKIEMEITGTMIRDKDSKWETSPFSRFLRDIYNKYVIPSRVNEVRMKLEEDVRELKDEVKAFLELTGKR